MSINDLILEIERNHIDIAINDSGNLSIVLSKNNMKNQPLIETIKARKEEIIGFLKAREVAGNTLFPVQAEAAEYWQQLLHGLEPTLPENVIVRDATMKRGTAGVLHLSYQHNRDILSFLKQQAINAATALNFTGGWVLSAYYGESRFVWGNMLPQRDDQHTMAGPGNGVVPLVYDFYQNKTVMEALQDFSTQLSQSEHFSAAVPDMAGGSLFSVYFRFRDTTVGTENARSFVGIAASPFSMEIIVTPTETDVMFEIHFRADLFPEKMVKEMMNLVMQQYNSLGVIRDQLLVSAGIFRQDIALARTSGPKAVIPAFSLVELFSASVKNYPGCIAVEDAEGGSMTYATLDERSNYIANLLTGRGISGPVGIYMHYSVNLIAGVLGVLKAGCSIVSLEHGFPANKLQWLAKASELSACILGEQEMEGMSELLLSSLPDCILIGLPEQLPAAALKSVPVTCSPADNCILYYTSGSTGEPKIVRTCHQNVLNGLVWLRHHFPATRDETFCMNIRLSFSPSVRNIFEALSQGARLLVIPESLYHHVDGFCGMLAEKNVTRISLTPSFVKVLIDGNKMEQLKQVRLLELRGEAIKSADFRLIHNAVPGVTILCRYGATEASSTVYNLNYDGPFEYYPIGKPTYNTTISIVDSHLNIKPLNVVGEILVEGSSVSAGYLNAGNNENAFRHGDSFPRAYRTGDLGFMDENHVLHYVGRKNRMIKLRGYRIEPGEIEYTLEQFEGIIKATVLLDSRGEASRLAAFCQVNEPSLFSENILKQFLSERLPAYEVPARIMTVKAFPRTVTGKIDYMELQEQLHRENSKQSRLPASVTEERVYTIFTSLMPDIPVSIDEDLYAMGANSIVLMRAAFKLGEEFNIKLKATQLFASNTIGKLAAFIERAAAENKAVQHSDYELFHHHHSHKHIFFMIPPLTGMPFYAEWASLVPAEADLVMFAPVAADRYRTFGRSMETLAVFYKNIILQLGKGKMIYLAGWALGASLTFEICLQLEAIGVKAQTAFLVTTGVDDKEEYEQFTGALEHSAILTGKYQPAGKYTGKISLIGSGEQHDATNSIFREYCTGEISVETADLRNASELARVIFSGIV
ncbi:AMP-binding protein [Chitinophaga sp.]|uniref:AMP-binding protein n=1 Tax=Chitinophaga sp. TaxID=1869181 RepID=UPI002BB3DF8F|nr:AMP-binding protein [Chitinophaga sp.]HWV64267.1 AMP-binding protein [Chitinophaga sp.]